MIEVNNISFKYAGQKNLVFDDFSLELKQDTIYGLLGKNGTGKSPVLPRTLPRKVCSTFWTTSMSSRI